MKKKVITAVAEQGYATVKADYDLATAMEGLTEEEQKTLKEEMAKAGDADARAAVIAKAQTQVTTKKEAATKSAVPTECASYSRR